MLMLHQALPHSHHQHELNESFEISGHHHSHANGHSHDKKENEESNDHSGLLGFLLGNHAHTYHANDFQVRKEIKPQITVKVLSSFVIWEQELFSFEQQRKSELVARFSIDYQHPYLSTYSVRGPPALG